jgi:hypothetical protein
MFAYGGGVSAEKSLASNAISFDTGADGRAILTPSHDGQASGPGQSPELEREIIAGEAGRRTDAGGTYAARAFRHRACSVARRVHNYDSATATKIRSPYSEFR